MTEHLQSRDAHPPLAPTSPARAASDILDLPAEQPQVEQELIENFVRQLRVIFLGASQWREGK